MQRVNFDPNRDAAAGRPGPEPDHARRFCESLNDPFTRRRLARELSPCGLSPASPHESSALPASSASKGPRLGNPGPSVSSLVGSETGSTPKRNLNHTPQDRK